MNLCRFSGPDGPAVGLLEADRVVPLAQASAARLASDPSATPLPLGDDLLALLPPDGIHAAAARDLLAWLATHPTESAALARPLAETRLLVPVPRPGKILLLAGNYAAHVAERGGTVAERAATFPYVFLKPTTTLTHPGDPIVLPRSSPHAIDWEAELGVVIGRGGRDIAEADALGHVAGYTVVNDISDRRFTPNPARQTRERDKFFDWLHGKWHDTFCPMGPGLLAADAVPDPQDLRIQLAVNGQVRQDGTTGQMIFPVAAIVAFVSSWVRLEPGDIISTGTPSGVGSATGTYLQPGDEVVATIDRIGRLSNPVVADQG